MEQLADAAIKRDRLIEWLFPKKSTLPKLSR